MPRPAHRLRALVVAMTAVLVAVALAGCGSAGETDTTTTAVRAAPALSSVTPLKDPRSWTGDVTARIAHPEVDPVAHDPRSHLPVTLKDAQGTSVTVKDTSRILALDVYGTYARTVYELGLGSHLVGSGSTPSCHPFEIRAGAGTSQQATRRDSSRMRDAHNCDRRPHSSG